MASRVWNDINLPGIARSKEEEKEKAVVTGVEDNSPEEEPEDEVRIVSAEWVPGSKGFQYNEQCFCDVKAEYLKETSRAKLRGNLHGIYDGIDEDMGLTVEGCIDDATMIARITIPKLYFINNDHYAAWQEDSSITCKYYLKDISHSLGANKIDSPMLDMPNDETAELQKLTVQLSIDPDDPDCQNDTFTLFSTDDVRSYEQVKTVQDDALKNNNTVELVFTDLDENLTYTLEHDNGDGDKVVLLQNRAYGKWAGATEGLAESKNGGGLFKKIGDTKNKVSQTRSAVNDKVSQAKSTVNDKVNKANQLKQNAVNQVNEAKAQVDGIKQSATDKVNEVKSQTNDIKSQGEAAVKDKINQANEIKQSATNQVNEVKSQVNAMKQNATNTVSQTKSQATGSLKDRLAAINSSRENAQKAASAAKEKTAEAAKAADQMADSLKSVPKLTI